MADRVATVEPCPLRCCPCTTSPGSPISPRVPPRARLAIVSSGGTAKAVAERGVPVTDVADLTGVPAILDHRVVTLHPKVHGGLLADPTNPAHQADMAELRHRADLARGRQPLPVHVEPGHRADRHRRAGDGAGVGQEPRPRRRRRRPRRLRRVLAEIREHGESRSPRGAGWPATRSPTPPPTTPRSSRGSTPPSPSPSRCRPRSTSRSSGPRPCATARTRTSRAPATASPARTAGGTRWCSTAARS